MSADLMTLIAAAAVAAIFIGVRFLGRWIEHGEARFDSETGKLKDDE